MKLAVTYSDGRKDEAEVKPRDRIALERQFGISVGKLVDEGREEHIYFLAWAALDRENRCANQNFDDWLLGVDAVEPVDLPELAQVPKEGATTTS